MRTSVTALAILGSLLAAAPAQAATDGLDATLSPLDLASATLRQDGDDVVFTVRTGGQWASRVMTSRRGRSLCLIVVQDERRFVCAGATPTRGPALTVTAAGGAPGPLTAAIERPDLRTLVARFAARDAGLAVGRFTWTVTTTWSDSAGCATPRPECNDRLPDRGSVAARLRPPTPTGCAARGASYRTSGPRSRRAVALTFADGPSSYTARTLDILRRHGAKGTFFVIGQQVSGGRAVLRRALREGHELANHSWNHANLSGGGRAQLRDTNAAIRRATGFTPCLFRAPYGAVSGTLIGQARDLGMLTIQWDVDPQDWARPGADAIAARRPAGAARVLGNARSGSIVVMHDGGGPREQTLAALPHMISTLRRRGYRLVTVSELLGLRPTYG
ncbi:MAG TPA: polysaccharide deacetylase family protein [Solirubrobacteraceae bacterium]|nr:polysaccharide deacetylase family protein [Solirubrobacteraceae bacterium]